MNAFEVEPLDLNKIAVDVATKSIEGMARRVSGPLDGLLKRIRHTLSSGMTGYVEQSSNRLSYVRTILHGSEDIPLQSIYVSPTFKKANKAFSEAYVISEITRHRRVLVTGTAGGGKSLFIKNTALELFKNFKELFPVFIELRSLDGEGSLMDAVTDHLIRSIRTITQEIVESEIRSGHFVLMLDGFDELNHDKHDLYAAELEMLGELYPEMRVVMTSRIEEEIVNLPGFHVYEVQPLSKSQCVELLYKTRYEEEKKLAFIERVESELYSKHRTFLSNPLLTNMMLMTFSEAGDVPTKIVNFYKQVYEVLFYKHDRSKGVWKRNNKTEFQLDEFERVFAFFCARSYADEKFQFSDVEAISYVNMAMEYEDKNGTPAVDFLSDLLKNVCLLQRDGLYYAFVHRSFQEYFAAVFISRQDDSRMASAIRSLASRAESDEVIEMLYQLNPDAFERTWALPWLKRLADRIRGTSPDSDISGYLRIFWNWAIIEGEGSMGLVWRDVPEDGQALSILQTIYPELQPDPVRQTKGENAKRRRDFVERLREDDDLWAYYSNHFPRVNRVKGPSAAQMDSMSNEIPLANVHPVILANWSWSWPRQQRAAILALEQAMDARVSRKSTSFDSLFEKPTGRGRRADTF